VDHIATLAAVDVTEDIVTRIPQTEGFVEKLARPARDVEMLIGMDNQGWMPVHKESSQLASDNLLRSNSRVQYKKLCLYIQLKYTDKYTQKVYVFMVS